MNRRAVGVITAGAIAGAVALAIAFGPRGRPAPADAGVSVQSTPGVVLAIRDVARLEATTYHIEKVVEAGDEQSKLWGLFHPKDVLLMVAVGDVVAGVDLSKVRDEDVVVDGATHSVHVRVPAPEIMSASLDERATHVYSRRTDVLATRNERLEGEARRAAEEQMRKQAIDAGILERARASADQTLRALLRSLGFVEVDVDWADRG